jgi:hypothetical protein
MRSNFLKNHTNFLSRVTFLIFSFSNMASFLLSECLKIIFLLELEYPLDLYSYTIISKPYPESRDIFPNILTSIMITPPKIFVRPFGNRLSGNRTVTVSRHLYRISYPFHHFNFNDFFRNLYFYKLIRTLLSCSETFIKCFFF